MWYISREYLCFVNTPEGSFYTHVGGSPKNMARLHSFSFQNATCEANKKLTFGLSNHAIHVSRFHTESRSETGWLKIQSLFEFSIIDSEIHKLDKRVSILKHWAKRLFLLFRRGFWVVHASSVLILKHPVLFGITSGVEAAKRALFCADFLLVLLLFFSATLRAQKKKEKNASEETRKTKSEKK